MNASYLPNVTKTRATVWGCIAAGMSLGALAAITPGNLKIAPVTIGLGLSIIGLTQSRELEELEESIVDHRISEGTNRRLGLLAGESETPKPFKPPSEFGWKKLMSARDANPFILLLSEQGGGKTTLAGYLLSLVPQGTLTIAATSHFRPEDFSAATKVVQLDLSEPCDFRQSYQPISQEQNFGGNAYTFLDSILMELRDRQPRMAAGKPLGPDIDIFLDECPALYHWFKNAGKEGQVFWDGNIMSWLTEIRKYGIRVIIGAQAKTIAAIGMEGYAALLDGYPQILLGGRAIKRAKELELDKATLAFMEISRCCVIRDVVYTLPAIEVIRGSEATKKLQTLESGSVERKTAVTAPVTSNVTSLETVLEPPLSPGNPPDDPPETPGNQACNTGLKTVSTTLESAPPDLKALAIAALANGASPSVIIKEVWGYKGRKYAAGREKWNELMPADTLG